METKIIVHTNIGTATDEFEQGVCSGMSGGLSAQNHCARPNISNVNDQLRYPTEQVKDIATNEHDENIARIKTELSYHIGELSWHTLQIERLTAYLVSLALEQDAEES